MSRERGDGCASAQGVPDTRDRMRGAQLDTLASKGHAPRVSPSSDDPRVCRLRRVAQSALEQRGHALERRVVVLHRCEQAACSAAAAADGLGCARGSLRGRSQTCAEPETESMADGVFILQQSSISCLTVDAHVDSDMHAYFAGVRVDPPVSFSDMNVTSPK